MCPLSGRFVTVTTNRGAVSKPTDFGEMTWSGDKAAEVDAPSWTFRRIWCCCRFHAEN